MTNFHITSTDGAGAVYASNDFNNGYQNEDGLEYDGTVAAAVGRIRFSVELTPHKQNGEWVLTMEIRATSGVVGSWFLGRTTLSSYPTDVATTAQSLVRCVNSGAWLPDFPALESGLEWSELFFSEQALVFVDKDMSLQGYAQTLVNEEAWDIAMQLLVAMAKTYPRPLNFVNMTGYANNSTDWMIFIEHFVLHGIKGMLIAYDTDALGVAVQSFPVVPNEDHGVEIYHTMLSALTNLVFILQSRRPKKLYKKLAKQLDLC
jgi:hypothetical protein